MALANLRSEERIGLGIALALHVALGAAFLLQPAKQPSPPPVEKMTVTIATEVGLKSTAPDPVPESAAARAPAIAPEPAPAPAPAPAPSTAPAPAPFTPPQPAVRPAPVPPRPIASAIPPARPRPAARSTPTPKPAKSTSAAAQPRSRTETPKAGPAKTPARAATTPASRKPAGGSRIGSDFLPGAGESTTTAETRIPASQIGASAKASLVQAIARKIKPKWSPPDGPEVNEITTYLRFRLNPDGSLAGRPEMIRQTGVNDVNRAQAGRHAEQAIRAVQLAAPFDLPDEYYDAWKLVGPFGFDWKLAQ